MITIIALSFILGLGVASAWLFHTDAKEQMRNLETRFTLAKDLYLVSDICLHSARASVNKATLLDILAKHESIPDDDRKILAELADMKQSHERQLDMSVSIRHIAEEGMRQTESETAMLLYDIQSILPFPFMFKGIKHDLKSHLDSMDDYLLKIQETENNDETENT